MTRRRLTAVLGVLMIMATLVVSSGAPAFAGTLTAASFTASTPYTYTSAGNARYDYGFTTATTSTLSKVTMGVPAGTNTYGPKYLALPGITGNYTSTPDSPANSLTGDYDLRALVSEPTALLSGFQALVEKASSSSNQSYSLGVTSSGLLQVNWSTNGLGNNYYQASTALSFSPNTPIWLRATAQLTNGSNSVFNFYTSSNGTAWTQLGITKYGAIISGVYDSTSPIEIGTGSVGTAALTKVNIYLASAASGISGTTTSASTCTSPGVVVCFNPSDASRAQAVAGSWVSSSAQAETWSINRSGTNLPTDIASDLIPTNITGLPVSGTANYRLIDGLATYNFVPTSIASGTPCTVSLQGFTNTTTPGSYTSLIKTYNNSGPPPVAVDSVTTPALVFTADSSNTNASVTIDPTLTFTVSGLSGSCNGVAQTAGTAATATSVALGHVTSLATVVGAQQLELATNAGSGFTVYVSDTAPLTSSNGHAMTNVTSTNTSPSAFSSVDTEAFGYTTSESALGTGTANRFTNGGAQWSALSTTNAEISYSAAPTDHTICVAYQVGASTATPAGSYSTTVIYTAVPLF